MATNARVGTAGTPGKSSANAGKFTDGHSVVGTGHQTQTRLSSSVGSGFPLHAEDDRDANLGARA